MERRQFIYDLALGSVGLMTLSSANLKSEQKLTVLHTNDTHSHIDPFPESHAKYASKGGVESRFNLIQKIRAEDENLLLLDAGDIFQGTPYFNIHKGELEIKLMSAMGYDAATMGNHDFDAGLDGFKNTLPHANFPFLCANYDFSDTILKDQTKPYQIFKKGGLKIGVFGVGVELEGLVSPAMYGDTQYLDPIRIAQHCATELKKDHQCNLVICLSHLGYHAKLNAMCDTVLAKETCDIDLIIGGHSHTFLEKAELFTNKKNKPVLINQVGWAGLYLGRLDFYFNSKGEYNSIASTQLNTNYLLG